MESDKTVVTVSLSEAEWDLVVRTPVDIGYLEVGPGGRRLHLKAGKRSARWVSGILAEAERANSAAAAMIALAYRVVAAEAVLKEAVHG